MSFVNHYHASPAVSEQVPLLSGLCTAWNRAMLIRPFQQHNLSAALLCNVCVIV
ncbi:hypothetical protein Q7O_001214 [Pectobacterium carotovorum subsp. carotovorum PCCS1]|nr:hypothetical protein [Pectobacterium carotovorum subsp. carotovorum PCCS1]